MGAKFGQIPFYNGITKSAGGTPMKILLGLIVFAIIFAVVNGASRAR